MSTTQLDHRPQGSRASLRTCLAASLLWLFCPAIGLHAAGESHTSRADLIGAWKLLRIETESPAGIQPDDFYGPGTTGLLIYDASGAISVQIAGEKRPSVKVPLTRPVPPGTAGEISAERAAFHSYYAYTGTWQYDEESSVCTHHVEVALLSVEQGMSYRQEVRREGDLLVFIRRGKQGDVPVIHRKVWQKI